MKDNPSQSASYLDYMMAPLADDLRRQGSLHMGLLKLLHARPDPVEISVLVQRLNATVQTTVLINLRGGAGTNYSAIKQLPPGTLLILLETASAPLVGQSDQWLKVQDPAGSEGFVNAGFVAWLGGRSQSFTIDHLLNLLEFFSRAELVEILPDKSSNQYLARLNERGHYLASFIAQQGIEKG